MPGLGIFGLDFENNIVIFEVRFGLTNWSNWSNWSNCKILYENKNA